MYRASIVIRCFNEEEHIGRLLHGVMRQTEKDVEIVLVDSGSTDDTVKIASRYPIKLVTIRPEDFSFGRALNLGCDAASGEFLVFASAHVYPVYKTWLEKILAPFEDPQIGLVYGKQRGNESTKYSEKQVFASWFGETSQLPQDQPFCNNANTAIRKSIWQQVPYDESLTGLEDLAWAKRIIKMGHKIGYEAGAEIIHVHNEAWKNVLNRYRREAIALKRICPEQQFRASDFVRLLASNVMSDYYHAWHDGEFWKNLSSIPMFRTMQFWGSYRGFNQAGPPSNQLKQIFYYPRGLDRNPDVFNKAAEPSYIEYPASADLENVNWHTI